MQNHLRLCDTSEENAAALPDTSVTDAERMKAISPPTLVFVFANYIRSTAGADTLSALLDNAKLMGKAARFLQVPVEGDAA